jgi:uncharacterized protein (TIGR02231 family)
MYRIALGLVTLAAAPAFADDIHPPAPIQSVIVYPAGAGVVRSIPAALPAGESVLVISDLPAEVETNSIKVDGHADGSISIGSVATRLVSAGSSEDPARRAAEDSIQALEDKLAGIDDRIAALDGRRTFIERMIQATPDGFAKMLAENAGGIERWTAASATLGADLDAVSAARRGLEIDKRAIDADLQAARKKLEELPPPRDRIEVRIEVSADAPATATFTVAYHVPSARWEPAYDAQLSTGDRGEAAGLSIVRRAEVTQATGEDWSGVALTLSTARPAGGTAAPYLYETLASLGQEYDSESSGLMGDTMAAAPAPAPAARAIEKSEDARVNRPAEVIEAAADFGDFRAEYNVPGKVSVATGVGARAFRIATESTPVDLEVRAVPVLTSAAYLTAKFQAPAGAPFLAGKVALFRDGSYVGQGDMPFVNAGSKVDLGFGVDDRVKVTRVALDRETAEHGILSSRKTDTRRFKTTVENLHRQPVAITILDRVPYAEDEKIKIVRLDDTTAPTKENVDDRRGVLAWTYTYQPGEKREIRNGYEVSWPAGEVVQVAD